MDATSTPATITPPGGAGVVAGQPPPMMVTTQQQANAAGGGHGSVGAVIGVVAAIAVLGIIAGMIGRLCSGRTIMGYGGHFDVESWVETKCSSCVDGHVGPPPPRRAPILVGPPVWDSGPGGRRGGVAGNGTTPAPFPATRVPMTRELKTEAMVAAEQQQEEDEEEEERESSEEEQLRHRHRHSGHSHRVEEEQREHPEILENHHHYQHQHQRDQHHDDIRRAPS